MIDRLAPLARPLGWLGLVPFIVLAAASVAVAHEPARLDQVLMATNAYAATIVSFLGAVHWGLALTDDRFAQPSRVAWSVLPSLVGWIALLLAPRWGVALLLVALVVCRLVDGWLLRHREMSAYLALRTQLTVGAGACLAVATAVAHGLFLRSSV